MKNKALILDLDNTIFPTKSMDPKVFEPFFEHFALNLKSKFKQNTIDDILGDLWQYPWDYVINKFSIPLPVVLNSIKILDSLELNFSIEPYPDYRFIREMPISKYLVTTSLTSLQEAKMKALKIENDFKKVIINDTFKEAKTKLDIFKELMNEFHLRPESTFVVGDNSDSEIKAGNELNMVTIQILREDVIKGKNAKHHIKSFSELDAIINKS